eukprot:CAMPEP_0194594938 /NCGR_PEP_ID=MMETSP0292-20121207/24612_1 /TAXON_ID=39354 /ORGANISM="Heterosigma akashiwo, Strain CCMP2393" /LENGTH=76 /DNA_ID=CAMNT_0039454605 /DNA_START=447 /DNA_END=673 /DNA_ORIENTATION=+
MAAQPRLLPLLQRQLGGGVEPRAQQPQQPASPDRGGHIASALGARGRWEQQEPAKPPHQQRALHQPAAAVHAGALG